MSSAAQQNLIYALIQVVHNFGAVAVVGISAYGTFWLRRELPLQRRMALLLAVAWALQVIGGIAFGFTSYHFYGHLPDIHGVAVDALSVKATCAGLGFILAAGYYETSPKGWFHNAVPIWAGSLILGCIALGAAAFLRWFS